MAIIKQVVDDDPAQIRRAILAGINAKPPASIGYLKLAAEYMDGTPKQIHEVTGRDGGPIVTVYLPQKDASG